MKKIKMWAFSKPRPVTSSKKTSGKFLNGMAYAGQKVGQWTVIPGLKAYDVAKGKKK
jgi:hypothetical protein